MATKKNTYIDVELDFAEEQLASWKRYIEAHPIETLTDRMDYKETKTGGVVKTVIANIEAQGKYIQEMLKNYLALLKEVEMMREKEALKQKNEVRGQQGLTPAEEGLI